jgi:hypothetical protein
MVAFQSSASLLLRQLKKINLELTLSGPKHCVIKIKCADITKESGGSASPAVWPMIRHHQDLSIFTKSIH